MSYAYIHIHIPFPIKAIWEKGSGGSPLEGIFTPFPTGTARLCPAQLISHLWWTGGACCWTEFLPYNFSESFFVCLFIISGVRFYQMLFLCPLIWSCVFTFTLFRLCIIFMDLQILYQPCIFGIKLT